LLTDGYFTGLVSEVSLQPVLVEASPAEAGKAMLDLLSDEYGAVGEQQGDTWRLSIAPIDNVRRGTIIYRVIQASRSVDQSFPGAVLHLITEDGNRWRIPPPSL
jgi:hypothetical protein